MPFRTIPARRSGFALALVFSVAAHAAVATSTVRRTPPTPIDPLAAFEVDVVPAPDDPPSIPLPNTDGPRPTSPAPPSPRAQTRPSHPHAAPAAPLESPQASPRPESNPPLDAPDAPPRFAITLSNAPPKGPAAATAGDVSEPSAGGEGEVLPEQAVDVPARLQRGATPRYPEGALADGLEGDVQLELVVSRAGDVESARVIAPAGHRFDEEAMASARRFHFAPALKNGRAVRARLRWSVAFRLR